MYKTIWSALRAEYPELSTLRGFTSDGYKTVKFLGSCFEVKFPDGTIKRVIFNNERGELIE